MEAKKMNINLFNKKKSSVNFSLQTQALTVYKLKKIISCIIIVFDNCCASALHRVNQLLAPRNRKF